MKDCFEVGVADQKKANNVFLIITEKNGSQGEKTREKYLLSAETRSEMNQWISDILSRIKTNNHNFAEKVAFCSNTENRSCTLKFKSEQAGKNMNKKESVESNFQILREDSQAGRLKIRGQR